MHGNNSNFNFYFFRDSLHNMSKYFWIKTVEIILALENILQFKIMWLHLSPDLALGTQSVAPLENYQYV